MSRATARKPAAASADDDDVEGHGKSRQARATTTMSRATASRAGQARATTTSRGPRRKSGPRASDDDDVEGHGQEPRAAATTTMSRVTASSTPRRATTMSRATARSRPARPTTTMSRATAKMPGRRDDDVEGHGAQRLDPHCMRPAVVDEPDSRRAAGPPGCSAACCCRAPSPGRRRDSACSSRSSTPRRRLFDAEAASIALFERDPERLEFRVAAGAQGAGVVGRLGRRPPRASSATCSRPARRSHSPTSWPIPASTSAVPERTGYVPRSIAAVPLIDGDSTGRRAPGAGQARLRLVLAARHGAARRLRAAGGHRHRGQPRSSATRPGCCAARSRRSATATLTDDQVERPGQRRRRRGSMPTRSSPFWGLVDLLDAGCATWATRDAHGHRHPGRRRATEARPRRAHGSAGRDRRWPP